MYYLVLLLDLLIPPQNPSFHSLHLILPASSTISSLYCESYELNKYHFVSFPSIVNKCSVPFELVNSDTWVLIIFLLLKVSSTSLFLWIMSMHDSRIY